MMKKTLSSEQATLKPWAKKNVGVQKLKETTNQKHKLALNYPFIPNKVVAVIIKALKEQLSFYT